MHIIAAIFGTLLIAIVLLDVFETIVLPRRVTHRLRLTRLFYRLTWFGWSSTVYLLIPARLRENCLGYYGPVSLLMLLMIWAAGMISGFACLYWADGFGFAADPGKMSGLWSDLYFSSTTFFTLGIGDVAPRTPTGRILTVIEAGVGFGLLALVISYLPALNQSFSRREINISLMDSHAGSPPSTAEVLRRHCSATGIEPFCDALSKWELWTAELLESHLSYPVLAYFRSQHDNQSWLGALATILDTSAFALSCMEDRCSRQAQMTFAIARHAVADLSIIFRRTPEPPPDNRLPHPQLQYLRDVLKRTGVPVNESAEAAQKLSELRLTYEPYIYSLSAYLRISIPPWIPIEGQADNWVKSAWETGRESHF